MEPGFEGAAVSGWTPARPATGIYQVPASGGAVTRRFSSVAFFSPKLAWAVRPSNGDNTILERLSDGRRFNLPTRGADVTWTRSETRLAYTRSDTTGNFDRRLSRVYVADVFGAPRQVATLYGGGVSGWVNDTTLLLSGKAQPGVRDRELFTLDIRNGARRSLGQALSFRGVSLSPDGAWVVYYVAFDSKARNGLWIRPTAGVLPKARCLWGLPLAGRESPAADSAAARRLTACAARIPCA
ncbi:hypothetical protein ACFSC4_16710 [Deinococcus malanensis]|uniref:hypothetical protein n=1 Tax=Deinococcus malanensis TaxID=1706855 RepID=UPI00362B8C38